MLYKLGVFNVYFNSLVLVLEETKIPRVTHGSRVIYFLVGLVDFKRNADSRAPLYNVMKAFKALFGRIISITLSKFGCYKSCLNLAGIVSENIILVFDD